MFKNRRRFQFAAIAPLFFLSVAHGAPSLPQMNGIRFSDHKGFEKDWRLVTVRFRTDTGEQRFVYANDLAWKALRSGEPYADGAVLAKIGLATTDDPDFTSSKVPSGARRYQFMVRDAKKYADTGGWGYALFDSSGGIFKDDPQIQTRACYACHRIIPQRHDVFSQAMSLSVDDPAPVPALRSATLSFSDTPTNQLPKNVTALLPRKMKTVRILTGALRKNLFQGTLDEIRPLLISEAVASGKPALLLSADGQRFSMIIPGSLASDCAKGLQSLKAHWTIKGEGPGDFPVSSSTLCAPGPSSP